MFGKKHKQYYEMCEKQFEEMKSFYKKLGYSDEQTDRFCKNCFGAEIRVAKQASYSTNWTFWRKTEYPREPLQQTRMMFKNMVGGAPFTGMRSASAPIECDGLDECMPMMEMAEAAPPVMNFAAGVPAAGAVISAQRMAGSLPTAEFSTAETHNVPENEIHSPLDSPQCIFSANVNTASWSYLRSRIAGQKHLDKNFVRIEEIINSYKYKLPLPEKDDLFSVSAEWEKCPWDSESEILFVGLKGKKADTSIPQNLALLVDVSGSMDDEWVLVQMSIAAIISNLKKGDVLSIIAYSDETVTVAKKIDGGDTDNCISAVMQIDGVGGCTNGSDGLENAYAFLRENYDKNGNNRVFIFTDGDFNFGITAEGGLKDFIYKKRETGIYLSVVGFGEHNFKDNKMETLAQNGNGNYTFISNPNDILDELDEKLISNLVTVAKDVKISVELNPEYVSEYRLIGYDARRLTQQEFHDTKKAADGIGSEHNVAALIKLKRGKADQKYPSRYVKTDIAQGNGEIGFVEIHYKSPEGEDLTLTKAITLEMLEKSSCENVKTAAILAMFGLLIRESDYKEGASAQLLKECIKGMDESDEYSHFGIIKKYIETLAS